MIIKSGLLQGKHDEYTTAYVNTIGNTRVIGNLLFTDYLLPFEITSILLFVRQSEPLCWRKGSYKMITITHYLGAGRNSVYTGRCRRFSAEKCHHNLYVHRTHAECR